MGVEKQSHSGSIKKLKPRVAQYQSTNSSTMPSILSFFENLFSSNELITSAEDTYIDDSVDEALARPNPFAADPIYAQHHHVVRIVDFMQHDHHLTPWLLRESHESVLHDPRFSLNHIVILHH